MRVALGVEYDGRRYYGWQSQPGGNTIQDRLEAALSEIACSRVQVVCAGRTDSGVHALEQVVHFDTHAERFDDAWVRGTNAHLPHDIAVRWARRVSGDFHARFAAQGRRYRYIMLNRRERPGLENGRVGWCHVPLDVEAMGGAAKMLLGEHDFSAFRSVECQAKSAVKLMRLCTIRRDGDKVVFDFSANAFLHHMVRNLVGSLIYVGMRRKPVAWIAELLEGKDRSRAAPTCMPDGLYFLGAEYDPAWNLPRIIYTPV